MLTKKLIVSVLLSGILGGMFLPSAFAETAKLTLENSITLAFENNEQIKAAESKTKATIWDWKKAKGEEGLNIGFSHTSAKIGGAYWKVYNVEDDPSDYFINEFSASLPLYTGGKLENIVKQANIGINLSDLQLEAIKQDIKYQTIKAYYDILDCKNIQKVREDAISELEEHLQNVQDQFYVGSVARVDVLRSEVALANAKQNLVTAQNNLRIAQSIFNKVVGLDIMEKTQTADELGYEPKHYDLAQCVEYALQHQPEVFIAEKSVSLAATGQKIAAASYKPEIAATATYATYDTKINEFNTKEWLVGINVKFNIFDNQVTHDQIKAADANIEAAEHQKNDTISTVELAVQQAYLNMTRAESNIETNRVAVEKAKEDFKLAGLRYKVDLANNVEVMDAQVALTTAKTAYEQSLYDYNLSKAELEKAMGVKDERLSLDK
jgi:outer membrane protein TolC